MSDKTDAVLAKEKVLAVYPDAELVGCPDGEYAIFSRQAWRETRNTGYIGRGQTGYRISSSRAADEAWIDASRLPTAVPKEGE